MTINFASVLWNIVTGPTDALNTLSAKNYDGINPISGQGISAGWRPGPNPTIYANRPYRGGMLQSVNEYAFGYFEIQMTPAQRAGQIGGLYLGPITIAELDTSHPDKIHIGTNSSIEIKVNKPKTFGFAWTPTDMYWLVDGAIAYHITNHKITTPANLVLLNKVGGWTWNDKTDKFPGGGFLTVNSLKVLPMSALVISADGKLTVSGGAAVTNDPSTATPTASFVGKPVIPPAGGIGGALFSVIDPVVLNGTITGHQWKLGNTLVSTDPVYASFTSDSGYLTCTVFAGSISVTSDPVLIRPAPPVFRGPPTISPSSGIGGTLFTAMDLAIVGGAVTAHVWTLNGVTVSNASTYQSVAASAGSLTVTSTAIGPGGTVTSTSAAVTITAAPPVFAGKPDISPNSGTGGQVYTVADPSISNATGITHSWKLNGAVVSTTTSYASGANDNGSIVCTTTATGPGGSVSMDSDTVSVTAVGNPVFNGKPVISPNGATGATTYSVADPSITNGTVQSHSWSLNGAVVSTGATYTSGATDAGSLTVTTTATGPGGTSTSTSNAVTLTAAAPIIASAPTISPNGGTSPATFTVTDGTISNQTGSPTHQWYLNGTAIIGATNTSFTSQSSDAGSLTVTTTATGPGGKTTRTSAAVTLTAAPATNTYTPVGATAPYKDVFVEDFSTPISFRTGGPDRIGYESGTGRYAIGPYYRTTNNNDYGSQYTSRGFFENNSNGGHPIANCYVDPLSPVWSAAGFDTGTMYKIVGGILEHHNFRVTNADGSIVPGMEQVAALFPPGMYAEKWLCTWIDTRSSIAKTVPLYYEHTTKYSTALGNWPTMWMLGRNRVLDLNAPDLEIDVGELTGQYAPNAALNFAAHNQITGKPVGDATLDTTNQQISIPGAYDWNHNLGHNGPRYLPNNINPSDGFHTYGATLFNDHCVYSIDNIKLHTATFTTNSSGPFTIPSLGMYGIMSMGGMGGNGGTPTPGVNEIVNYVKNWKFGQPA